MELLTILKTRFKQNPHRHPGVTWENYHQHLIPYWVQIEKMEVTGGEPDLYVIEEAWMIIDSSKETPKGRINSCYDKEARLKRKKFPPNSSALEMADSMGIRLCDEKVYGELSTFEVHDEKTSSWILTPEPIRALGGALFADARYGRTFTYHNGADSYYSTRGFRGMIKIK
jgi:hypothetical protein